MGSQNNVAWKEFLKKHPEYIKKSKKKNQNKYNFLCQCKRGKCPICKCSEFSFIGGGTNVYPIKMNFTR